MWIMLKDAFISVVINRDNPDQLLARARVKGDLERVFTELDTKVVTRPKTADYRYGMLISREDLAEALAQAVADIDYPNFKDAVKEKDRHDAYLRCWTAMIDLQDRREGENGYAPPVRRAKRTRRLPRTAKGNRTATA